MISPVDMPNVLFAICKNGHRHRNFYWNWYFRKNHNIYKSKVAFHIPLRCFEGLENSIDSQVQSTCQNEAVDMPSSRSQRKNRKGTSIRYRSRCNVGKTIIKHSHMGGLLVFNPHYIHHTSLNIVVLPRKMIQIQFDCGKLWIESKVTFSAHSAAVGWAVITKTNPPVNWRGCGKTANL